MAGRQAEANHAVSNQDIAHAARDAAEAPAPLPDALRDAARVASEQDPPGLLIPIQGLDLTHRLLTREQLERLIPHRGAMMLLDGIVWRSPSGDAAVAIKHIRDDEFWVPGHFPGKPMFPGVLMVETGAQLAAYIWNALQPEPQLAAFLRIEHAVFRRSVAPGDDLIVLCREIKRGRRRFESDVQGVVRAASTDEVAFEARVIGMAMGPFRGSVE